MASQMDIKETQYLEHITIPTTKGSDVYTIYQYIYHIICRYNNETSIIWNMEKVSQSSENAYKRREILLPAAVSGIWSNSHGYILKLYMYV